MAEVSPVEQDAPVAGARAGGGGELSLGRCRTIRATNSESNLSRRSEEKWRAAVVEQA